VTTSLFRCEIPQLDEVIASQQASLVPIRRSRPEHVDPRWL